MDIETSNAIKLFFPNPSLTQVFYEAIANSLDASATEIAILIEIDDFKSPDSLRITIQDNGTGFTDESFERFKHLLKPQDAYHKGLGRLVFLNYFSRVDFDSTWDDQRRTFTFSETFKGHSKSEVLASPQTNRTSLVFTSFSGQKVRSYDDLKPGSLKSRIIEQFLPTLHTLRSRGSPFEIKIDLKTKNANEEKDFFSTEEVITAADVPVLERKELTSPFLDSFDGVDMNYRVKAGAGERALLTAVSIDGRTIPIKLLTPGAVPLNHSAIFVFSSKLFHGNADTPRQKLVLPEGVPEGELMGFLRREVGAVLAGLIPQIEERNEQTKKQFEQKFPHLLGFFEESTAGLIDRDEALDIAQRKFFKMQKQVLQCEKLSDEDFEKSLELSSRSLTEYILYRDLIIRKMREMNDNNSEADIHNLIVPRYQVFAGKNVAGDVYRNNAWLLDDKFMSFQTILSEKRMKVLISHISGVTAPSDEDGRPDIAMIFSADPEASSHVDVVVVEIKPKTDDEKENMFAINQLLDRAQKLVDFCPSIQRVWYYAVLQVNDVLARRLQQQKWAPLFSKGQVFYQEFETRRLNDSIVPTPTFVLSFDAIIGDAECRNHTFLEILKAGMRARVENKTSDD